MLVYLEESSEEDRQSRQFEPPVLGQLARTADFFNLGTTLFLQTPSAADRLELRAWSRPDPLPSWHLDLDPPLRLRLTAGVPQVLTGPERPALSAFAQRWAPGGAPLVALPLVGEPRTLLGTLVLLEAPPFDLEDEDFVLAWTQYKYTLIQSLQPRRRSWPQYSEATLMRTLEAGHAFLCAEIDTAALAAHCDRRGLPFHRARRLVEESLAELSGPRGAVLWRRPVLTALFVLPQTMDEDLLWRQIEANLAWPEGFEPVWTRRRVTGPRDLQTVLGL